MEAPKPISKMTNDLINYKSFEKDNCKIIIGKNDNNIIIRLVCQNGINLMENKFSYNELIQLIKPFRVNENIDELYSNIIELFNNKEFILKEIENEEKIEIKINIYNNKGVKENYSLFLKSTEQDFKKLQKIIIQKIVQLEKENKILIEENKKLNENNNKLNNEILDLKNEIKKIYDILNETNIKKIIFNSQIITDIKEMQFIINKIEGQSLKKIKELKLLYRASENEGSSKIFHQKCDGKVPTITIILSKNNYKFGGFTEKSWSGSYKDDSAFCFSINLKKIYNIIKGTKAIGGGSEMNGPIFYGHYNFIQIGTNAFIKGEHHSCNKNSNYEGVENNFEISGGEEHFEILDYEVFQVIF